MSVEDLLRDMVRAVASADVGEVELVRADLARLPEPVLAALNAAGIGIRVCHGTVTDYRADMRGKAPRGWPTGLTWDVVPGCYLPDERNVCIATITNAAGKRIIPPKGFGHNAWSLVLHETMHADDYAAGGLRSQCPQFVASRERDLLSLDTYQSQAGQGGTEETYAESAARCFGQDPSFSGACPNLLAFWQSTQLPVPPGQPSDRRGPLSDAFIGTAQLLDDGAITLDLRGDDELAVGGHAYVMLPPDDPRGAAVAARLRGRRGADAAQPLLLEPFLSPGL